MKKVRVTIWADGWFGGKTRVAVTVDDDGFGVLDESAKRAFQSGHCHSLALAIHQITHWQIKGVGLESWGDTPDSPSHCVVWSPELKRYVDVTGANRRPDNKWRVLNKRISPVKAKFLGGYLNPNVKLAMPFARSVLRDLGLLEKFSTTK
jgi:hypothetical protein